MTDRPPELRLFTDELIVDNFAGGGGASTGIGAALGRDPDIAINHDPEALQMHAANHPSTRHLCENVWDVDPVKVCAGRPVGCAWFSPDCTFHSKARGGKPFRDRDRARRRRGLAWVVVRWAKAVKPRVILLENVEEFEDWGPLGEDGMPDPARRGLTFRRWVGSLRKAGYAVEWRELRACDYGAPTSRKRLFVVARCDGEPIVWPEPTHGPGRPLPYRTAAECIDWSIPCPSIFDRKRPLAEATLRRIARGIKRYVIEATQPFIVPLTHQGGERVYPVDEPMRTVTCANRGEQAVVSPLIARIGQTGGNGSSLVKLKGTCRDGQPVTEPLGTVQAQGNHYAEVRAFLLAYYGTEQDPQLGLPLATVTTKDRFAVVTVAGVDYAIVDIGMRMLEPRELFNAQSFPPHYQIAPPYNGKPLTKTAQVRMCGNSVSPVLAQALARAQFEARGAAEVA